MLQFKQALKILEKSREFSAWKKKNPESYLSYALYVVADEDTDWKIGFYNKKHDKVTSFNVGKKITIEPEEEILRRQKTKVGELKLSKIKHDLSDAVAIANNLQKEEFSAESPLKIIAILQRIAKDQVWNITFLTQTFNTLNFKIKCDNGKVIEKKLQPLFQFQK